MKPSTKVYYQLSSRFHESTSESADVFLTSLGGKDIGIDGDYPDYRMTLLSSENDRLTLGQVFCLFLDSMDLLNAVQEPIHVIDRIKAILAESVPGARLLATSRELLEQSYAEAIQADDLFELLSFPTFKIEPLRILEVWNTVSTEEGITNNSGGALVTGRHVTFSPCKDVGFLAESMRTIDAHLEAGEYDRAAEVYVSDFVINDLSWSTEREPEFLKAIKAHMVRTFAD